jgi:hypothetical protein
LPGGATSTGLTFVTPTAPLSPASPNQRMQARLVVEDLAVDHDFIRLGFPQNRL